MRLIPVTLPPGRAKLAMRPLPSGSPETIVDEPHFPLQILRSLT
jgi:hypothetical protein